MADFFRGFERSLIDVGDVHINVLKGGKGKEAVLLLHGHPESHLMWHKIAPRLADKYTVVLTDLRGYVLGRKVISLRVLSRQSQDRA